MYVLSTLFQINSFGVYFTDSLLIHEDTNFAKNIIPDLHFEKKGKWKPLAWNKLEITFTASKTKHGLILGNFAPDESIKSTPIVSKKQLKSRGYHSSAVYYYFDEIYLEALDSIVPCDKKKNKAFLYQDSSRHMSYQLKTILDIPKPVIIEKTKTIPKDTLVKILNNKITKPKIIEKIELNKVFVLENILFKTNSDELLNSSFPSLDELGKIISKNPKFSLSITGHTDNVGSFQYNQVLSQKRAIAVSNYLNQKWAIDFSKLKTSGKGEELPIATNNTESGRKINRRVEFKINH